MPYLITVQFSLLLISSLRIQWVAANLSPRVNQAKREDTHNADIKTQRSCTSIIPHVFMTCARACTLSTHDLGTSIK
jgi:hypothetical protein